MESRIFNASLYTIRANKTSIDSSSAAYYGWWESSSNNNVGLLVFDGASTYLTGKNITSINFSITSDRAGGTSDRTVQFWSSQYQSVYGGQAYGSNYANNSLGSYTSLFYNNTQNFTLNSGTLFNNIASELSQGHIAFVIYNPNEGGTEGTGRHSTNYLKWTSVSITVTYGDAIGIPYTSSSSVSLGSQVNISINNYMSGATYNLSYNCNGATGSIINNLSNNYTTWTIPTSIANNITSSTSAVCTITCTTIYNGTSQGSSTCTITLTIPSSYKPSTPTITLTPSSNYTQSLTEITFAISSSMNYVGGGSLTYRTTFDGKTYTAANFKATPKSSGSLTISAKVTDSRGRSSTNTKTITVIAYTSPVINSFTATRCDSNGNTQTDGDHIKVSFSGTINENSGSYAISYKASTTATNNWTTSISGNFSTTTYSRSNLVLNTVFSDSIGYDIKLTFSDTKSSAVQIINIGSKSVVFDIIHNNNADGIAFGRIATETNTIRSAWPMYFTNDALALTKTHLGITGDGNYVSKTGDTMTGDLTIQQTHNPEIFLNVNDNFLGRIRTNNYETAGALLELAIYDGNSSSNTNGYGIRVNSPSYISNNSLNSIFRVVKYVNGTLSSSYNVLHTGWFSLYKNDITQGYINGTLINTTSTSLQSSVKIVYGTAEIPSGGADCNFGITFDEIPVVFCQIYAGADTTAQNAEDYTVQVRSVTTTKFCAAIPGTLYSITNGIQICWIAIGK